MAFTGGGGEHRVFALSEFSQFPGKLGAGVDLKRNGYILVEPSGHVSGKQYQWEASSDPRDGVCPSPLPDWIRDLSSHSASPQGSGEGFAVNADLLEMQDAAKAIPSDDRDTWLQVGMAFHSTGLAGAFSAWDSWAQSCPEKYSARDQTRTWASFRLKGISGVTKASLYKLAQDHGWVNRGSVMALDGFQAIKLQQPADAVKSSPLQFNVLENADLAPDGQRVFRLPGALGAIQDYYNQTAPIPQPLFAVQCALGIGSVALGRHFCTDTNNYSALFFLNITKSANGKEHVKTITERVLEFGGFGDRIAGDGYTSQAGVISALKAKPVHISVIDEAGKYLEASKDKANVNARSANKSLMEAIGRCGGVIRSQNYSTMGSSNKNHEPQVIYSPSLTIQAMTTPTTFYSNISQEQIDDGFLGRFVVCHSHSERVPARRVRPLPVPEIVLAWFESIRTRMSVKGNLAGVDVTDAAPEPIVLHIADDAETVFYDFACEMVDEMNRLDKEGLSALLGRAAEFSRRLGLIIALSRNPNASTIGKQDALLAVDYIRNQSFMAVQEVRERMTQSQFAADKRVVLDAIKTAGERGLTHSEMQRQPPCSQYKERDLSEILKMLQLAELASYVNVNDGERGRPRLAWVATEGLSQDSD
jgi:hypothetical protein